MIKVESAHIEEMRGIRKLEVDFRGKTFAISGPNGSGKSGVIDAIEFGLTGQIGRLTGRGTQGLSVAEHGPHVDKTNESDTAFVELRVFLPMLGKAATITRKVASPKKPKIVPADADVKAVFAEIAEHPEITLSRREILRLILVEPAKRSEEIQTILKLEEIGHTRSTLNTVQNKLDVAQRTAAAQKQSSGEALQLHLEVPLRADDILEVVNRRRKVLGLPEIAELIPDTRLDAGLATAAKTSGFNKQSAVHDLEALSDASKGFSRLARTESAAIVSDLTRLEAEPALLAALQRRSFIEKGLELVDGPGCPLCDVPWEDEKSLREHLKAKLAKSEEARRLQQALLDNSLLMAQEAIRVTGLLELVQKVADWQGEGEFAKLLGNWRADLAALNTSLTTVEGLTGLKDRLTAGWLGMPTTFLTALKGLVEKIDAIPDQTATVDAQTFINTAQVRLDDYRALKRRHKVAEIEWASAKAAYETYCDVMEDVLNTLYEEVQEDFGTFYRELNEGDEAKFTAKLTPSKGRLEFDVDFYERGLFPPAAYHSEGHQDGMGVSLYLALMKRLFGAQFTFALLDDVVMSVDAGHRRMFCKMLKKYFPDTQFIITTHDRVWAEQMKSSGLVTAKTSLTFHGWTIDNGPLVESNQEVWDEIAASLGKGRVETAAAALRRYLEFASRNLAHQLGATIQFRADGNYELGELLPGVLTRVKSLCGKGAEAAQSWRNDGEREAAMRLKTALSNSAGVQNVEQWAVNKAVHYNEWANFGRKDFEPVVAAFRDLLGCLRCSKCESWVYVTPRVNPEALRCDCNAISINLKSKQK